MKNIIISIVGIVTNIVIYIYSHATEMDLRILGTKIWLLFVLPLILAVILMIYIIYEYFKFKNKSNILSKILIVFFLLLIPLQFFLFFNNGVIV